MVSEKTSTTSQIDYIDVRHPNDHDGGECWYSHQPVIQDGHWGWLRRWGGPKRPTNSDDCFWPWFPPRQAGSE